MALYFTTTPPEKTYSRSSQSPTCADDDGVAAAGGQLVGMFTAAKLWRARSRLCRSQILQVNTRWKALAEIYTMHAFAPFILASEIFNFRFRKSLIFDLIFKLYSHSCCSSVVHHRPPLVHELGDLCRSFLSSEDENLGALKSKT